MSFGVSSVARSTVTSVSIGSDGVGRDNLGPELQVNWDMSLGTDQWTTFNSTVAAVVDGAYNSVRTTATSAPALGSISIAGLTIGKVYRVSIAARRGAQGTTQSVFDFTWASVSTPLALITATEYESFEFDVTATATSGTSSFVAAASVGGAADDEVYVRQISIKEIL